MCGPRPSLGANRSFQPNDPEPACLSCSAERTVVLGSDISSPRASRHINVTIAHANEAAHHTVKMGSSAMGSDLVVLVDEERFDYLGEDTFEDTFVRASCVTNLATRVQDARSEMRNPRKPVGPRGRMRGGREHLAHPRRALGAGGRRFKSGRPDFLTV